MYGVRKIDTLFVRLEAWRLSTGDWNLAVSSKKCNRPIESYGHLHPVFVSPRGPVTRCFTHPSAVTVSNAQRARGGQRVSEA
ncbi:unnamed protein product, partial [Dicrocoelium dendriticum]